MGVSTLLLVVALGVLGCMATDPCDGKGCVGQAGNAGCSAVGGKCQCKDNKFVYGTTSGLCTDPCNGKGCVGQAGNAGCSAIGGKCQCKDNKFVYGTTSGLCTDPCGTKMCKSKPGDEKCSAEGGKCVCAGKSFKLITNLCKEFNAKIKKSSTDVSGKSIQVKGVTARIDLTCSADPVTGTPNYAWKDGNDDDLSSKAGYTVVSDSTLQIDNPANKAGTVKCEVTDGVTSTAVVTLTDKLKVVITNKNDNNKDVSDGTIQTKGLTGDLTLACKAAPLAGTAEYKWTDDKDDQLGSDYDTATAGEVKISNPGNKAGKLKCTATDSPTGGATKSTLVTLVKSGSANLQMSYLMLGLVTLVSAVWSGRVC